MPLSRLSLFAFQEVSINDGFQIISTPHVHQNNQTEIFVSVLLQIYN